MTSRLQLQPCTFLYLACFLTRSPESCYSLRETCDVTTAWTTWASEWNKLELRYCCCSMMRATHDPEEPLATLWCFTLPRAPRPLLDGLNVYCIFLFVKWLQNKLVVGLWAFDCFRLFIVVYLQNWRNAIWTSNCGCLWFKLIQLKLLAIIA